VNTTKCLAFVKDIQWCFVKEELCKYIIHIKLLLQGFIWVDLFVTYTSYVSSVVMINLSTCNKIVGLVVLRLYMHQIVSENKLELTSFS